MIDTSNDAANDGAVYDLRHSGDSGIRCQLLLVFSQAHIVRVLKAQFEHYNCQTNTASSAESALKMIHAGSFSAVVIDINLSGMGGEQLCASINRQMQHRKPQLFLSGDAQSMLVAQQTDWPSRARYLGWPINASRLLGEILALDESAIANKEVGKQR